MWSHLRAECQSWCCTVSGTSWSLMVMSCSRCLRCVGREASLSSALSRLFFLSVQLLLALKSLFFFLPAIIFMKLIFRCFVVGQNNSNITAPQVGFPRQFHHLLDPPAVLRFVGHQQTGSFLVGRRLGVRVGQQGTDRRQQGHDVDHVAPLVLKNYMLTAVLSMQILPSE